MDRFSMQFFSQFGPTKHLSPSSPIPPPCPSVTDSGIGEGLWTPGMEQSSWTDFLTSSYLV